MKNEFCWTHLQSTHLEASKEFYLTLFDWKLTDVEYPLFLYHEIDAGKGHCGGMMSIPKGHSSTWVPFIKVDDIHAYAQKAKSMGGKILTEPTPTPDNEFFCVIEDPLGAVIGLHQPSE